MYEIVRDYWSWFLLGLYPNGPIGGLALTIFLAVAGLVLSFPLSVLIGVARAGEVRAAYLPASAFVHVVRGLPVLMLIFWCYYIVPLLFNRSVSGTVTLIVGLVIYEMAFLGEVVRSGIEALPKGQTEAARTLGLNRFKTLIYVVLPQALFNVIPSIVSQFINLIKNTSLGYVINVGELTYFGYQVTTIEFSKPIQVLVLVALLYFIICFSLSRVAARAESFIKKRRGF